MRYLFKKSQVGNDEPLFCQDVNFDKTNFKFIHRHLRQLLSDFFIVLLEDVTKFLSKSEGIFRTSSPYSLASKTTCSLAFHLKSKK